ncbi:putative glycosyl transferase family protein [Phaeomoniella chlamydospora]|uniref:Putative glycosyl transferase family protein n=1 Tax=Phaeomoniella chlamydospora TaxID=158046 RepID=A0A0G2GVB2_PHACM|nr:putative glycosyl transferase family protein [Phaeomoniella chlamydospora]
MFVFEPNETVWQEIVRKLESLRGLMGSEETKSELISPQTFMAEFFRDRWLSLSWKFNALRTIRYYHPRIWSDDEVIVVSYLNVKPWEHRLTDGGIAALLRPDNLAYRLWWMCYNEWKQTLDLHPRRGSWHRDLIIFLECLMPPAPHPASEDMAIRSNKNDLDPLTRSKISEKSPATSSGVPTDVATPTDPIQIQTPAHLFDIVSDESLLVRPSLFQYVAGLALSSVLDADFIPSIQDLNQSISFTAAILMIRKLNRRK